MRSQYFPFHFFWATVCKTVRPMLSDRCLSVCLTVCVSVCLVTLVYCGQTMGWIKMPLGTEECLGPGHTVLDGDPAPQKGTAAPDYRSTSNVAKRLDGSRCHYVRWGPSSPTERGTAAPLFCRCLLWPSGSPSQQLLSSCLK